MILIYDGVPGSGKSYVVIRDHYLPYIEFSKGKIFTNIKGLKSQVAIDQTCRLTGKSEHELLERIVEVDDSWFNSISANCPNDCLVLADESHRYWCNRNWKDFTDNDRNWFAETRHFGVHVICISQTIGSIEKFIVSRAEYTYSCLKLSMLGMPNKFVLKQRVPSSKTVLSSKINKYDKKIFPCYKSFQVKDDNYKNKKSSLFSKWLFFPVFLVFLAYLFISYSSDDSQPLPLSASSVSGVSSNQAFFSSQNEKKTYLLLGSPSHQCNCKVSAVVRFKESVFVSFNCEDYKSFDSMMFDSLSFLPYQSRSDLFIYASKHYSINSIVSFPASICSLLPSKPPEEEEVDTSLASSVPFSSP